MRTLAIDIETYSSVSLQKCGVYAYAQSPDFEILLFGYAWDDGPVEVIDLARGESLPEELQNALYDPEILKTAFNASFERTCLSAFMGRVTPPEQWSCTAVMARELGLPGSLEAVGEVIGLPEDKQKSKTGRALIRYFSISWLYPYYNKNGELAFRVFPGYEIMPFWADAAHTELDSALRLYPVEVYYGTEKKIVKKVDLFTLEGVTTYIFENGVLTPDTEKQAYVKVKDSKGNEQPLNWERFPLIPIKYNPKEVPLIRRGRSLQDAINLLQSDFVNNMEEDVRNTVLVLKNYDGQDLGEFRRNLTTYGAIKVRTVEGTDGGVDSLEISVNSENYKTVLELLKKALIENLRSYDAKDDRLSGTPNQMNIQSMYCDIDLDANAMETELQASFEEILWFVNTYLANTGKGSYESEDITVIFNRDILINESEAIDNCSKSVGIISDETIVAMHPWVDDPAAELERLEKQKEETDPYRAAFEQAQALRNPEGGDPVNEE